MKKVKGENYKLKNPNTVKKINEVIKKEKEREGLWRTREQIADKKYNEYCKREGVKNTNGGWQNRKWCSTKSLWEKKCEECGVTNLHEKPRWEYKSVKIKTHEAVILHDGEEYDAYEAEVEKMNGEILVKIIYGRRKLYVRVREADINDEDILKIALQNRASVYEIIEVEE